MDSSQGKASLGRVFFWTAMAVVLVVGGAAVGGLIGAVVAASQAPTRPPTAPIPNLDGLAALLVGGGAGILLGSIAGLVAWWVWWWRWRRRQLAQGLPDPRRY